MGDPRSVYASRLAERRGRAERLGRIDRALGLAYLAGVAALLVVLYLVAERRALSPGWLVAPLAPLAAFAWGQWRSQGGRRRARMAVAFYERGLSRLDGSWAGRGETGERFVARDHPYARHLDVVGGGSLFQMISTATTSAGQEVLARWLTAPPAAPGDIRDRQEVVSHLRDALDLRERLAACGGDEPERLDPADLRGWGEARLAVAVAAVWRAHDALRSLAAVSRQIEVESFDHPELVALQRDLLQPDRASASIAALGRRVAWLTALQNDLIAPFAYVVGGQAAVAFAIERWRRRHGPRIGRWLEAVGRIEALCAIAGHSYEHPGDPFPEIADGGRILDGNGLGHPLLPEEGFVRNDLRLGDGAPALLLLSGSNMSGKSTFLRTVGVNAVLAFAGAPVRATRLRISPFTIGASLRVEDSLLGGASRFYAEITRLRTIVELADGSLPVLHLVDEILAGTNSHDRALGAAGVLRALVEKGAIGICTTHDLALAEAARGLGDRALNAHFGDRLVAGRLLFDYRLKPGVVHQSNAIELMRAVGLRV